MNATIIVPFKYVDSKNSDNIVTILPGSSSYFRNLVKTIHTSPFECIIILNSNLFNKRMVNIFKSYYAEDKSLLWNENGSNINTVPMSPININKINQSSSFCFNKRDMFGKTIHVIGNSDLPSIIKAIASKLQTRLYYLNPTYARIINDNIGELHGSENKEEYIKSDEFEIDQSKKSVLFIVDVVGWAWWIKSQYIKKYLSDSYNIHIVTPDQFMSVSSCHSYDLYLTFGFGFIDILVSNGIPFEKRISGMTAHRPLNMLQTYFKKVRAIHTNSMLLYNMGKIIHEKVFYTPNGVDTELFRPTKKKIKSSNLMVGHIGKHSVLKGQDEIIIPSIKAAGCSPFLHLNDFTTRIPYESMYQKYQNMDVFLVASKEDGTPNPALEAMACGVPVISNRIGNMPEIIQDGYNGFLVDFNIKDYVDKLTFLKNNQDLLPEMGKNARKVVVDSWTWENNVKYYKKMFDELLGE